MKKPFYKKWWFLAIVLFMIVGVLGSNEDNTSEVVEPTTEHTESITEIANTEPIQLVAGIASTKVTYDTYELNGKTYKIISVDGGNISGEREANVAVNIGFGDRDYWGFTNEYAQLIYVLAPEIVLQDALNEPVLSTGRYYSDEAKVSGTESPDLDEGHVIADSLGGVANAYNITPQDRTLNQHGNQAYMEKVIRDAGGCTNFFATITYASTDTQIPLRYKYEYEIFGEKVVDAFLNVNPDKVNDVPPESATVKTTEAQSSFDESTELKRIDTNGNGKITIAEAKAAGFKMPIYNDHWLYKYMDDRDGDGMVGE